MNIEQIFTQFAEQKPEYTVTIDKTWTQGRTMFGGISAALCYQAAENLIEDGRAVRSFHVNFIGPLLSNEPITVTAEILRTGKNVTQIVATASQNDRVCSMAQVCFGVKRDSKLLSHAKDQHDMQLPKKGKFIPKIPKIVPEFIQHFDLALDKGNLGFGKSDEAILHGWSRFKKAPQSMSIAYLIALMDAWPPTMFQMLRLPAPASTMSWDVEFIEPELALKPEQWFASETEAVHIRDGYGHEEAKFWDQSGNLIALSRQVVTVFA
ncbi:MAG: thioesterase family protein [Gammaproteobacteria bacterium]|nr:thioesterase family protein [Gammaproteobacteria bacterium]